MRNGKHVLGVSGSLRAASLNTVFLWAMSLLCPVGITFEIYDSLDKIPLFNVDDESKPKPAVDHWRNALSRADLVLLASPEYAHGVTGVIKNALDWIVSSGELLDKPLSLPNLSVRARLAHSQLSETLSVMGAVLTEKCCPRATLDAPYILPDAAEFALIENAQICSRLNGLWRNIEHSLTIMPYSRHE
ncbi:NADPH-dependent FMN reductase [Pantoea piersonii]|jgi:chromate reductase|uniref:NADPH-dependent FMN reductase n=1 Tax=Pantoea piersonii TaxID=2364647 RepID=UPI000EA34469|nr:NADPH-dependent FMN reductase [Pantoea piersonii]MBZ6386762.1 NAD(P)H-dependent oxidoreductase [Pantoea piersonii]MBZ6400089.1 NAD(P)H-dependent oxidoreductase [Pantoea piersonii]MBZ6410091.1 NAD(P)H-dependent oxidoreductase [Pantoea piersonii]MBZ6426140.1 NAD(P)H-dependent oxidoreductase [Pantoea piersonii]NYB04633.1 NAD(P)H-dependent oxidoreductase [Pantoea piersonii]